MTAKIIQGLHQVNLHDRAGDQHITTESISHNYLIRVHTHVNTTDGQSGTIDFDGWSTMSEIRYHRQTGNEDRQW